MRNFNNSFNVIIQRMKRMTKQKFSLTWYLHIIDENQVSLCPEYETIPE